MMVIYSSIKFRDPCQRRHILFLSGRDYLFEATLNTGTRRTTDIKIIKDQVFLVIEIDSTGHPRFHLLSVIIRHITKCCEKPNNRLPNLLDFFLSYLNNDFVLKTEFDV